MEIIQYRMGNWYDIEACKGIRLLAHERSPMELLMKMHKHCSSVRQDRQLIKAPGSNTLVYQGQWSLLHPQRLISFQLCKRNRTSLGKCSSRCGTHGLPGHRAFGGWTIQLHISFQFTTIPSNSQLLGSMWQVGNVLWHLLHSLGVW